jgi:hypothetical protein
MIIFVISITVKTQTMNSRKTPPTINHRIVKFFLYVALVLITVLIFLFTASRVRAQTPDQGANNYFIYGSTASGAGDYSAFNDNVLLDTAITIIYQLNSENDYAYNYPFKQMNDEFNATKGNIEPAIMQDSPYSEEIFPPKTTK